MSDVAKTAVPFPKGVSGDRLFFMKVAAGAQTSGDVFVVTLPSQTAGVDVDALPICAVLYEAPDTNGISVSRAVTITSHDKTLGVTKITTGANSTTLAVLVIGYMTRV
jgi:hypothetical protein